MKEKRAINKESDMRRAADNLEYFVSYVSSPWRIIWMNFTVGVFRGLGAVIGASIVIAVMIWLLGLFTKIPLLGEYAKEFDQVVSGYLNDTNYNDEFDRMDETLKRIEDVLKETRDK